MNSMRSNSNLATNGSLRIPTSTTYQCSSVPSPFDLGAFQKILVRTNGSITRLLETCFSEQIQLVKLSEYVGQIETELPHLHLKEKGRVLSREVLLQGKISYRNFIYASSRILIDNLKPQFADELLNSKTPIGKIWLEQRVETFKEINDSGREPANGLSDYFRIEPKENLFYRTYSVFSQGKLTMIVTEKFPESYFCQPLN